MDTNALLTNLEIIGCTGNILSVEESIVLHNSLLLLQNENHFRKIYFWGRIYGTEKDYYIAYGYIKDILLGQVYYYSTNCIDWGLLPKPTEIALLLAPICTTRFQGDPALVIDILCEKDDPTLKQKIGRTAIKRLKEEDRLSATVSLINEEASIVPRGGLYKRPDGVVIQNLSFEGLTSLECRELKSYLHYREPHQKWNTNLLTRDDYNYAMDFLDVIDIDVPKGCWSIQLYGGGLYVIVKNLYWPGLIFFHQVETPFYGFVYMGYGKKIMDIPFMLPNIDA